jgi:hypothetical protein
MIVDQNAMLEIFPLKALILNVNPIKSCRKTSAKEKFHVLFNKSK